MIGIKSRTEGKLPDTRLMPTKNVQGHYISRYMTMISFYIR